MGGQARGWQHVWRAMKVAGICFAVAFILCLVIALIGGYHYKQQWTSAIVAGWQRVLGRWSLVRRTVAASWRNTWAGARVAGGLALFAGLLVAWFGVLVGASWQLVFGAVLAVVLAVFPLVYLLLRHPDAW